MSTLVVGATGHLGGEVATRLASQGEAVRGLVRDPDSEAARTLRRAGVELVRGDLTEPGSLTAACRGVRRVLATATAALSSDDALIQKVDGDGYQALVNQAAAASVQRFVFVSAQGFEKDTPLVLARAKAATEKALQESGLDAVILRPALFMESWIGFVVGAQLQAGNTLQVIGSAEKEYGFVCAHNVADLVLAAAADSRPEPVIPFSGGLASYSRIARWVGQLQGRTIRVESLPLDAAVPSLPPIVNQLWSLVAAGDFMSIETPEVVAAYGIESVSPGDFVRQAFGQGG